MKKNDSPSSQLTSMIYCWILVLITSQPIQAQIPAVIDLANLDPAVGKTFNNIHCGSTIVQGQCSSLIVIGDINGDGYVDSMYSDRSSDVNGTDSGTVFVLFGGEQFDPMISPNDFPMLDGSNGFVVHGINAGDALNGFSYQNDLNGDGIDDWVMNARGYDHVVDGTGAIYIVFGTTDPYASALDLSTLNGTNGFAIYGESAGDAIGSINTRGDFNGDQLNDIVVGAFSQDDAADNAGAVYVLYSQLGSMPATIDLGNLNGSNGFTIYGENEGDLLGISAGFLGDINHDGFDDIGVSMADNFIVGGDEDRNENRGPDDLKTAFVIYGNDDAMPTVFDLSSINSSNGIVIYGLNESDDHSLIRRAGDFNHDGVDDFLVNLIGSDLNGTNTGSIYLFYGDSQGFAATLNLDQFAQHEGMLISGLVPHHSLGSPITNPSDLNADGIDDLVISARSANTVNGNSSGIVYAIYGSAGHLPAVFDLSTLNGFNGFQILGSDGFEGLSPRLIYEVNRDGLNDLMIAGSFGKSHVIYGSATSDLIFADDFE